MARQQKRRRIELGWFEAVVLILGYVASLGIVGVAGIYIGQRAAHQHLGGQERLIRMPIAPEERGARGGPPGDEPAITFYDELGKSTTGEGRIVTREGPKKRDESRAARRAEPSRGDRNARHGIGGPGPAVGLGPAPGGASVEARATARGLAGGLPPGETIVGPGPGDHANAQKPGIAAPPVPVSKTPVPERTGSLATLTKSPPAPAAGVSPAAAATARPAAPAPPVPVADGSWSVQVNATRDETTADRLAERLRARGYEAYIVKQARDGVVWYRVRVGHLPTIEKANALVREIKEREGLAQAFVASD